VEPIRRQIRREAAITHGLEQLAALVGVPSAPAPSQILPALRRRRATTGSVARSPGKGRSRRSA
jgi:hypothetical protein